MKFIKPKFILIRVLPSLVIALVVWFFFIREKSFTAVVKQVEVQKRTVEKTITAGGIVEANQQADLGFLGAGKVIYLPVEKGQTVEEGTLLAQLDNSGTFLDSKALKDARDIALRQKELFEEKMYTNIDTLGGTDAYNIKLREYEENISRAEATYKSALNSLRNTYIYAPFKGTVTDVLKKQGETATLAETIVKIANLDDLKFTVNVDEEDYGLIKEGMKVKITLDSYDGNTEFEGTVGKLPFYAKDNGTFEISIDIKSKAEYPVRLGMEGDAYIVLESTGENVNSLNFDEIQFDTEDKAFIWTVKDNKLKKQYVEKGLEGDVYTQIKNEIIDTVVIPLDDNQKMEEGFIAKILK